MAEKISPRIGSTFEDFLRTEGTCQATTVRAIRRVLARLIVQVMKNRGPSS